MSKNPVVKQTLVEYLNAVNYSDLAGYLPSQFAVELVNLIKMINDGHTKDVTPVVHYYMLDKMFYNKRNVINICFRGMAKTTLARYIIWYVAIYGSLPGLKDIVFALYVTDTIENGVKTMKRNLIHEYENSKFLKKFIKKANITEQIWEFTNVDGKQFTCQGYGSQSGVRGTTVNGERPKLALLDDLMNDKVADSPTCIENIENTIYKAVRQALNPKHRKIIWSGTPFNAKDPLHKAVESGAWEVNAFPICEQFPCTRSEFRGAWPERFSYYFVKKEYEELLALGKIADFNQELMLRIMSDEDRLIEDGDINWYSREIILLNKENFNYYITTDFATTKESAGDFSVILVWAYSNKGHWFLVDGICKKQLMDKNVNDLFRLAQKWNPQLVGVEVSGQQGGFIPWIQEQMLVRNCFFNLASENNKNKPGIKPVTNKLARFNVVVPWFKSGIMFFPRELKDTPLIKELLDELTLLSPKGFKSRHDDVGDAISQLPLLQTWKPSEVTQMKKNKDGIWEDWDEEEKYCNIQSYIV